MQEKTNTAADNSARLDLKVYKGKNKVLKNKAAVSTTPMDGDVLEGVTSYTCLCRIVDKQGEGVGGGGVTDVEVRIAEREQPSFKCRTFGPSLT